MHQIQQIFCKKKRLSYLKLYHFIASLKLRFGIGPTWKMASLYHHFRFIDLVGLMSTNVKYIFVLEHIAKLNLYRRSYLKQVEFWFLSAFRFWKSAHLIQFLYFVSDESGFVEPLLRPFNGRSVPCAIYRSNSDHGL